MSKLKFSKFIAFTLLIVMFLLTFSGCSSELNIINQARKSPTNEELINRYKAYLSKYPDGEYAEEAREQIEFAIIRLAGQGNGFPEAAAFNGTDTETFRIFIIQKYESGVGEIKITRHEWNAYLPDNWASNTIYDASLYCILKEGDKVFVGSERYDNGMVISGYKVITDIEIREARTGNILYTGSLEGSEPVFPYWVTSDEYPVIKGSPANYLSFEDWLLKTLK